ncbi:uncharacterized protein si:cabz01074946.1 isoform X2 [Mugil cephalus]|uniref:uncharacterized protein si:cabz01074946.1 isoform X2 n=1 Tax=Mugil cephalus TaxID=48193 RepID=UPI001FB6E810|nr:uncharacterized protein si:cabz01074946.1 isoform X2 [Mugil cephalus]
MTLPHYFIFFLQVVHVISLEETTGYLGENVTLLSGANSSWNLSKIEWSIFSNNTWIATYRGGKINTNRVAQYKDRLSLNNDTGDLVINQLTTRDATEYTVDLLNKAGKNTVNKIKLIVTQRLKKPTISTVFSQDMEGGCWMMLDCTSPDKDVQLTWDVKPSGLNSTIPISGSRTYLIVFINKTQNFEFTCSSTTSKNREPVSQTVKQKCVVPEGKPTPPPPQPQPRDRSAICFIGGLIVGLLIAILIFKRELLRPSKENSTGAKA